MIESGTQESRKRELEPNELSRREIAAAGRVHQTHSPQIRFFLSS
jgi:hypothetical protein